MKRGFGRGKSMYKFFEAVICRCIEFMAIIEGRRDCEEEGLGGS